MDDAFPSKRQMFQKLESKLWKTLFETKDIPEETAKWFKMKEMHQRVYEELRNIETIASMSSSSLPPPSSEELEKIATTVSNEIKALQDPKSPRKRPVVICVESPFVIMMSDYELTDFELYKSKICSIRSSMDLECWQHWTSVRSSFWRHEDFFVCSV
jgi:hypothetical protein